MNRTIKPIMDLQGRSLIGYGAARMSGPAFQAFNPATGEKIPPAFVSATREEMERAVSAAEEAAPRFARLGGRARGQMLRALAAAIEADAEPIIVRATLETALTADRLRGELARTCNQLRLFANLIEEGSWVNARIDRGDSARKPAPKPDIRSMLRPLGPVAVFGASNFPLAFSVAGGDTASALAAGNPVIVKGHPAHPGTSELVGRAMQRALQQQDAPEGSFSLLFDAGITIGSALVQAAAIKAVGFTGSRAGGRALMELAAARPEPIPVFAEMSSTNPVFILPQALRARGEQIAAGLHGSVLLGGGQFCTKPGLIFVEDSADGRLLAERLTTLVTASAPATLLTENIRSAFRAGVARRRGEGGGDRPGVRELTAAHASAAAGYAATAAVFETDTATMNAHPELTDEIFGPSTLLVRYGRWPELLDAARALDGHLTATLHGTEEDLHEARELIAVLETKVGRLIVNGYPTGVEVCHAMVHGGPFPATSDARFTSVGTQAILRFTRPVCYQDFPEENLPEELRNANPLGIMRLVDGKYSRDGI
jgi:alpha-ketoglutaric semialdehyde dehydrogenase